MLVYRIAKTTRIRDITGTGARLFGGRWNRKGVPVVYTSETRSLATVEFLVHVPIAIAPAQFSLATLGIPDDVSCEQISSSDLPRNWRSFPAPQRLAEIGSEWAQQNRSLLLRIPSAVVEHEFNLLINPIHLQMSQVELVGVEKYRFDPRLFRVGRERRAKGSN